MSYQVELKNIIKDFGHFRAVAGVDMQIPKGEVVTLLGPSGCGKTTTLRMIAGLIRPTSGEVFIAGENVTNIPPYKRDVAMVFQNYALFPHLTVFENIVYGLRTRKIKDINLLREKAKHVLNIVQLENVEERYPRQLSGGQQQRVSLARALIVNPRVMLFDEPLSNLDAKLREQTRVEIRELLKKMGITAIYVTHDQEEALTISDRIAVMNKGLIEQITTPKTLYSNPETLFVADFVGHANMFSGNITEATDGNIMIETTSKYKIKAIDNKGNWNVGDKVSVAIRPENLRLGIPVTGQSEVNSWVCNISSISFLGSKIRYTVTAGKDSKMIIDLNPEDEIIKSTGNSFQISWGAEQVIVLPS